MTDNTIKELQTATAAAAEERGAAEARAIDAIFRIRDSVVAALGGQELRGLPNLGTARDWYRGLNVRATVPGRKILGKDASKAQSHLVINRQGQLVRVHVTDDAFEEEPAKALDLRAKDLSRIADLYALAVQVHIKTTGEELAANVRLSKLAGAIVGALGEAGL